MSSKSFQVACRLEVARGNGKHQYSIMKWISGDLRE